MYTRGTQLDIIKLVGGGYASNTYVLISDSEAAVVDPSAELSEITDALGAAKLRYILLTHGHFDHILTLDSLRQETHSEICIHRDDSKMSGDSNLNASDYFGLGFTSVGADRLLDDGDMLQLGTDTVRVISTPGHTPGSVCFDCGGDLICGDTLFSSGYGRYDLPGGDPKALFASLTMLAVRKDNPMIHPGHGASCDLASADVIAAIRQRNY